MNAMLNCQLGFNPRTHGFRGHTGNRDVGQVLNRPRQRQYKADNKANDAKHNGACSVLGHGVHHIPKREDMASHDEDREEDLAQPKQLSPKRPHQDLSCVCQVVDMRVRGAELCNGVSRIRGDDSKADNQDNGSIDDVSLDRSRRTGCAYGTNPTASMVEGSDRTPSDTDSAIITAQG